MKTSLPRSSRPVRTARAARSVAVVASVALVVGAGLTGTASAQDVEGTRAKVQRLAAEMDRLEARASELDEQYLQTGLELSKAETELKKNRDAVADAQARMRALLPSLSLEGFEDRALSEMSGGQRRRFDVALGLVHEPKLVFLDEPTTGLDPQSRANLWDYIRMLRDDRGVTIVLTTHYLDEADALADRIVVMDHGSIVADDTPDALKAQVSGDVISVAVDGDLRAAERVAADVLSPRTSTIEDLGGEGERLVLTVERGDTAVPVLLRALDEASLPLTAVEVRRPTLDDVFLAMTGRSLREEGS